MWKCVSVSECAEMHVNITQRDLSPCSNMAAVRVLIGGAASSEAESQDVSILRVIVRSAG